MYSNFGGNIIDTLNKRKKKSSHSEIVPRPINNIFNDELQEHIDNTYSEFINGTRNGGRSKTPEEFEAAIETLVTNYNYPRLEDYRSTINRYRIHYNRIHNRNRFGKPKITFIR